MSFDELVRTGIWFTYVIPWKGGTATVYQGVTTGQAPQR